MKIDMCVEQMFILEVYARLGVQDPIVEAVMVSGFLNLNLDFVSIIAMVK